MVTKKPFKRKKIKEITDKIYTPTQNYLWLPVELANKRIVIEPIDISKLEIKGKEKISKVRRVMPYKRTIYLSRVYLPKELVGKKIKLRIVK